MTVGQAVQRNRPHSVIPAIGHIHAANQQVFIGSGEIRIGRAGAGKRIGAVRIETGKTDVAAGELAERGRLRKSDPVDRPRRTVTVGIYPLPQRQRIGVANASDRGLEVDGGSGGGQAGDGQHGQGHPRRLKVSGESAVVVGRFHSIQCWFRVASID